MTTRIHRTSTQLDSEPTGRPPVRQSAQVPVERIGCWAASISFDGGHLSRATWGQGVGQEGGVSRRAWLWPAPTTRVTPS